MTKQDVVKTLQPLFNTHDRYQVLKDWFSLMANSIAIACGYGEEAAEAFKKAEENYSKEEFLALDEAFTKLSDWMTANMEAGTFRDWLGEIYMESCTASKEKAQHFTPYSVGKLCADMNFDEETAKRAIEEKGYVTFNDPCVGAGCLPIAFCATLKEHGINYQQSAVVFVNDNDQRCVDMCYVQLSLIGAMAIVENKDSLTQECKQTRLTPMLAQRLAAEQQQRKEVEKWRNAFKLIGGNSSAENQKPAF